MKWLIVAALIYFLVPYDLIPDFLGLPGRIDDLLVLAWVAWTYRSQLMQAFTKRAASSEGATSGKTASAGGANESEAFDPYAVLGITPSASAEMIQKAYRARMKEYHPDKVAHLGEELQRLAHQKSQQIERAYRQLQN
ncbi:MAG: DnaJ domain-containing protein [Myxococcota bacterium]